VKAPRVGRLLLLQDAEGRLEVGAGCWCTTSDLRGG